MHLQGQGQRTHVQNLSQYDGYTPRYEDIEEPTEQRLRVNYKEHMLKEGQDMQSQVTATKSTTKELKLLQNRISMLQQQEGRMKKQNEMQQRKIRQINELRRRAEEHKKFLADKKREREEALEQRRKEFQIKRSMVLQNRERSLAQHMLRFRRELGAMKQEKEERR